MGYQYLWHNQIQILMYGNKLSKGLWEGMWGRDRDRENLWKERETWYFNLFLFIPPRLDEDVVWV